MFVVLLMRIPSELGRLIANKQTAIIEVALIGGYGLLEEGVFSIK